MDTSASRKVKKNVAYKSIVSQQQVVPCYVVSLENMTPNWIAAWMKALYNNLASCLRKASTWDHPCGVTERKYKMKVIRLKTQGGI